jgi:adenosylmethionine-8-amino-7-oxononanoate aminotransferase
VRAADGLDALLGEHGDTICAVIVEPLVQGAGGMLMHDPAWLGRVRAACDRHGVHLIADEIAVGFGRTGTLFAHAQAGITPDFLVLSKGLTGGFLPLSAVLTTQDVYDAFYAEYRTRRAFLHSHSYAGNPLACAAARAVMATFREEPVLDRVAALGAALEAAMAPLADLPYVANLRRRGLIGAERPSRGRIGAACASTATDSNMARCCARSATWCTSCRRIASPRTRSASWSTPRVQASLLPPTTRVRRRSR